MTRNRKFIVAGVALAATGLAAAGAFAHRGGPWEHHGRGHHGGLMGMAFGGPMGGFCRGDGTEMADHLLVHIEHKVKLTDAAEGHLRGTQDRDQRRRREDEGRLPAGRERRTGAIR